VFFLILRYESLAPAGNQAVIVYPNPVKTRFNMLTIHLYQSELKPLLAARDRYLASIARRYSEYANNLLREKYNSKWQV